MLLFIFVATVLSVCIILSSSGMAHATMQIGENLLYEGKEEAMRTCPEFPQNHPRIQEVAEEDIDIKGLHSLFFKEGEQPMGRISECTGCWRQYIGSWEITDGRLYLTGLDGKFQLIEGSPLFADWYSGILVVPMGDILDDDYTEYNFEKDFLIYVEQGVVTKTELRDNRNLEEASNSGDI